MAQPVFGGGASSETEDDAFHGTSEPVKETGEMISHEVEDRMSSDADTSEEEDDAAQDAPRFAPGGTTYALQCNVCFKLRIVPSKEMYESIGEHILEKPFVCANAQAWRDDASCDDPADIEDNEPRVVFAIDKQNLPRAPDGFHRKVVPRAKNEAQFGDTYYKTPCGKTLRSMVQVQKYLEKNPDIKATKEQFSYSIPKDCRGSFKEGVRTNLRRFSTKETQPSADARKRIKGKSEMKTPGHGQPSRPQSLIGKGSLAKSKGLSASKPNPVRKDEPKLKQLHGSKDAAHLKAVQREKFAADKVNAPSG